MPYLAYLIRLRFTAVALKIDAFNDPRLSEQMMTAANSYFKAKLFKQTTQIIKGDIRVGCAAQDLLNNSIAFAHDPVYPLAL